MTRTKYVFMAMLIAAFAFSGSLFANSIFASSDGTEYPERFYGYDSYSAGMGYTGAGDLFRINNYTANPALMTTSSNVNFSASIKLGYNTYKQDINNQSESYRDDGLILSQFSFAFPYNNNRFGANIQAFSSGNFENEVKGIVIDEDNEYDLKNSITRNMYQFNLNYAYKLDKLSLGASVNYLLGSNNLEMSHDHDSYIDTYYMDIRRYNGAAYTIGATYDFTKYSAGISYRTKADLSGKRELETVVHDDDNRISLSTDDMEIADELCLGFAAKIKDEFKMTFDTHFERWSEISDDYNDSYMVGFGASYDPYKKKDNFFLKIPVRAGYSLRKLQYKMNNEDIMEHTLTMGISLPIKSTKQAITFSVELMKRGDKSKHGIEDNGIMFTIGSQGFDVFSRRKNKTGHRDIPKPDSNY